jgi:hypothetical protein
MKTTDIPEHLRRISLATAAQIAGYRDRRTIAAALERHGLPILQFGRKRSVLLTDLEKLIARCTYLGGKATGCNISP